MSLCVFCHSWLCLSCLIISPLFSFRGVVFVGYLVYSFGLFFSFVCLLLLVICVCVCYVCVNLYFAIVGDPSVLCVFFIVVSL